MNVQIRDLSSISISELVQVFNHAFADYAIPISLTVELMELKIDSFWCSMVGWIS